MRESGRGNVATSGEAEDADALRIDLPCVGLGSCEADGTLRIEQRHRVAQLRQAILQDDAGDAVRV